MDKTLGIVGLGRCGQPAAKRFIEQGYEVHGYARRAEVIEAFKGMGGRPAESPMDVAARAGVMIVMVLNDAQVIEVIAGENGLLQSAAPVRPSSA